MQKLGPRKLPPRYPHDDLTDAFEDHQNIGADVTPTTHSPTCRHLRDWRHSGGAAAVSASLLMTRLIRIKQRDGSSRSPQCRARGLENPALYTAYQQFLSGQTTSQQAMARSRIMEKMSDSDKEQLREAGAAAREKEEAASASTNARRCGGRSGRERTSVPVVAEQIVQEQYGNTLPTA